METMRFRRLELKFFLEDSSISIIEPKERNSGMLQGLFLKRQCVLGSNGKFITAADLKVG